MGLGVHKRGPGPCEYVEGADQHQRGKLLYCWRAPRASGRVLESRWTRMILAYILAVPVFVLMLLINVAKRYK